MKTKEKAGRGLGIVFQQQDTWGRSYQCVYLSEGMVQKKKKKKKMERDSFQWCSVPEQQAVDTN